MALDILCVHVHVCILAQWPWRFKLFEDFMSTVESKSMLCLCRYFVFCLQHLYIRRDSSHPESKIESISYHLGVRARRSVLMTTAINGTEKILSLS